jgi:hypothetical protein
MFNIFKKPTEDELNALSEIVEMYSRNLNAQFYLSKKLDRQVEMYSRNIEAISIETALTLLNKNYEIAILANLFKFKLIARDILIAKREGDIFLAKLLDLHDSTFDKPFHISEMTKK